MFRKAEGKVMIVFESLLNIHNYFQHWFYINIYVKLIVFDLKFHMRLFIAYLPLNMQSYSHLASRFSFY